MCSFARYLPLMFLRGIQQFLVFFFWLGQDSLYFCQRFYFWFSTFYFHPTNKLHSFFQSLLCCVFLLFYADLVKVCFYSYTFIGLSYDKLFLLIMQKHNCIPLNQASIRQVLSVMKNHSFQNDNPNQNFPPKYMYPHLNCNLQSTIRNP